MIIQSCTSEKTSTDALLKQPPYAALTDSIGQAPENADLYYKRGVLLYQNGEAAAAQDLKKAFNLQPTEQHALSVVTALQQQSTDSAQAFIKAALQQLPRSIALQIGLARSYQQQKNYAEAMKVCDGILTLYPASIDALLLKAALQKETGKKDEALNTLEKAYALAPNDITLAYQLAFDYAEAKHPQTIVFTERLIDNDTTGKQAQPYYFRGVYYANAGSTDEAIKWYDEAIAHDINFLDAYMDKGVLLYDKKRFAAALKVFQLANRVSPAYAESYLWAGKCQEALGQKAAAKLSYQRAFALDKSLTEARENAARF